MIDQNPGNRRMQVVPEKGAIYARLSRNRNGLSTNCEMQTAEARGYAEDQGVEVIAEYADDDISASKYSTKPRPDYERLLGDVQRQGINVIYVTELSRLYRRIEELLAVIKLAETTDLRRIETTDGELYQLDTAEGRHRALGAVNNAQLESERSSRRQKRKKAAMAAEGRDGGGERPYGYEKDRMTIREPEAQVIREMVRRYINGDSTTGIAYWLNEHGHRKARGGKWASINVRQQLRSQRIGGIRVHNGTPYDAVWPAIIDAPTFERLQQEIDLRASDPSAIPKSRKYLLTGLAHCGKCGKPLAGNLRQDRRGKPKKPYYVCRMHGAYDKKYGCGSTRRYAVPLEYFIKETVLHRLDSDKLAEAIGHTRHDAADVKELLAKRRALRKRGKEISEWFGDGGLDRAEYQLARQANEHVLAQLAEKLSKAQHKLSGLDIDTNKTLRESWDGAVNDEWRRRLLSLVIERIDLLPGRDNPVYIIDGVRHRFDPQRVLIRWRY